MARRAGGVVTRYTAHSRLSSTRCTALGFLRLLGWLSSGYSRAKKGGGARRWRRVEMPQIHLPPSPTSPMCSSVGQGYVGPHRSAQFICRGAWRCLVAQICFWKMNGRAPSRKPRRPGRARSSPRCSCWQAWTAGAGALACVATARSGQSKPGTGAHSRAPAQSRAVAVKARARLQQAEALADAVPVYSLEFRFELWRSQQRIALGRCLLRRCTRHEKREHAQA